MEREHIPAPRIRKRACPYCQKKLQAKSKGQWRNNLARHLGRGCQPFMREHVGQMLSIVQSMIELFMPGALDEAQRGYTSAVSKKSEVEELERLYVR